MTDDPLAGAVSDAFLQTNQRGADSHRDSAGIDWLKNSIVRKGYPMKSPDSAWSLQWRRFVVDVLIGASTVAVGFALIGALTGVSYTLPLLGASVLIGIGLLIEPNGTAHITSDIGAPSIKSGAPTIGHFDAPIIDATGG